MRYYISCGNPTKTNKRAKIVSTNWKNNKIHSCKWMRKVITKFINQIDDTFWPIFRIYYNNLHFIIVGYGHNRCIYFSSTPVQMRQFHCQNIHQLIQNAINNSRTYLINCWITIEILNCKIAIGNNFSNIQIQFSIEITTKRDVGQLINSVVSRYANNNSDREVEESK